MSLRIGIDPGASGAIVVLHDSKIVDFLLMPIFKDGKSTRVNGAEVANFMRKYPGGHVYLERVHSMPGQGVSSMFTFGHAAGLVQGVVTALGHPMTLVSPQTWKKRAGLLGTDKDAARSRAIQLFPSWEVLSKKGQGQALADATLIAMYGASD